MEPYIPVSPETPPINVEVPGEDLGPTVTPDDEGGVTVDFGETADEEGAAPEHFDNLAEYMDDGDLSSIAADLISDFDNDLNTRAEWEKAYIQGLDLLGLKIDERTTPWPEIGRAHV